MVKYSSIEFFEQLAQALNEDAQFGERAKSLHVSLLFATHDRPDAALLKIDHGKVSAQQTTPDAKADFVFLAPYATWITNHKDGVPLEKLILTGKVKFKGSIPKIMTLKSQLNVIDAKQKAIPVEY